MALGAVPAVLVADMTRTVYCSSEGLRIPLAIHRAVGQAHTAFRIAAAHRSPVERLLTLTGVYALLDPYPRVDAALAMRTARPGPGCDGG